MIKKGSKVMIKITGEIGHVAFVEPGMVPFPFWVETPTSPIDEGLDGPWNENDLVELDGFKVYR